MFQYAGTLFGYLLCLYYVAFRWDAVRAKYGRLDLIFWLYYVTFSWCLLGWLADIAVWVVWYGIWVARYGSPN